MDIWLYSIFYQIKAARQCPTRYRDMIYCTQRDSLRCQEIVSLTIIKLSKIFSLKFVYCRNRTFYENFNLELCSYAQSHALDTLAMAYLEIVTINMFFDFVHFREIILKSSRNVSETTPWVRKHHIAIYTISNAIIIDLFFYIYVHNMGLILIVLTITCVFI